MIQKPWEVIAKLEATGGRLDKEAIIAAQAQAGNDELFEGFKLACDNMITFGVRKVNAKDNSAGGAGLSGAAFLSLASKLAARELTGNDAIMAIGHASAQATPDQWNNWYRRILIKDLKAGFGESTVNRVCEKKFPQYAIPVFEGQLAHDGANHEEKICGLKLIESKLDGMRVFTIVYPDGRVNQFSRNGKELFNFELVKKQIATQAYTFAEPVVLDGEIMSSSFQDLMKQAKRKSDVMADDAVLNLFDILTLKEFRAKYSANRQIDRTLSLKTWFETVKDNLPNVDVLGQELVDLDSEEGQARFSEINALALKNGFEGIMLKDPEAPYECKRSVAWLKVKPFIEVSLTVLDVEEGKTDSKFVGTMGALVCGGTDDGKKIKANVGGGYSVQLRAQIWANHTGKPVTWQKKVKGKWVTMTEVPDGDDVVGQVVEVRADCLTLSQDSVDVWSLRFPRFRRFRGFKAGEKL